MAFRHCKNWGGGVFFQVFQEFDRFGVTDQACHPYYRKFVKVQRTLECFDRPERDCFTQALKIELWFWCQ